METLRLVLAWSLVWLAGIGLRRRVYAASGWARAPHPAWIAGTGFVAGAFVLTLIMRATQPAGVPLALRTVGVALVLLTAALWWPDLRHVRGWRVGVRRDRA